MLPVEQTETVLTAAKTTNIVSLRKRNFANKLKNLINRIRRFKTVTIDAVFFSMQVCSIEIQKIFKMKNETQL